MERGGSRGNRHLAPPLAEKKVKSLAVNRVGTKGLSIITAASEKETKMAKTLKTLEGVGDVNFNFPMD